MSETTSAPAAPAESSPAPASQPAISISDAARLLNQQRRQTPAGEAPAAPAAETRRPAPNDLLAAEKSAGGSQQSPTLPESSKPAPSPLSAMEKALGLPEGVAPATPAEAPASPTDAMAGIEIEGRRYTRAELREAVLKSTDYTRKTQEVADRARQLQAQQAALAEVLPYIQPELARLAQTLEQAPPRPDPRLLEVDPNEYNRQRAAWELANEEQSRLAGLNQLQQQARERAMAAAVEDANQKLAAKYPFWADPGERLKAQQQIVDWATTKGGFSRDELRGLASPHHLETMMKASMFDRWVESAKTAAPATLAAPARGVAPPPALSERVKQAEAAFEQKADWRTGAALLAARRAGATNGTGR
jgi:hypothetical protein